MEDEKPISDLIILNLMKAGYSCTCAFDGMEAADILEERNFDLIILDVMLPKLNGFELMEYIKPLGIPVIFLTAKATLDDRLRGLTSGAEDYMVKPFEIVELLARVNIVLRRYNKMEQQLTFKDIAIDTKNQNVSKAKISHFSEKKYMKKYGEVSTLSSRGLSIFTYRDCAKSLI